MKTYRVFKRSATNWEEFATANKITFRRGCTLEQARKICSEFNDNRTPKEIERGTKLELEEE